MSLKLRHRGSTKLTKSEMFCEFLKNLAVDNADQISLRYSEITASLNKQFRNTDSKTENSLRGCDYNLM